MSGVESVDEFVGGGRLAGCRWAGHGDSRRPNDVNRVSAGAARYRQICSPRSAVTAVTSNDETWISAMLADEYGLSEIVRSPMISAVSTFIAFLICGLVPLMPYLIGSEDGFRISLVATAVVFFAIGATKATWSPHPWWRSGLETLVIGLVASAVAYAIGYFLKSVV